MFGDINLDVSAIQQKFETKEQAQLFKISDLERRNTKLMEVNKTLEERIEELNSYLEEQNREMNNFSMSVSTKESAISKLKKDMEKFKKERDDAKKKAKDLLKESNQAAFLESQIQDLSKTIDKLSKDTDYEKKKNSKLAKENTTLRKDLEKLQKKIEGDNSPTALKSRLGEAQNKLSVTNNNLSNKVKEIQTLESTLNERNSEFKEVLTYVCTYLTAMMTWIDTSFLSAMSNITDSDPDTTVKDTNLRVYEQVPEILKAKKQSKSKTNVLGYLESLKDMLSDTKNLVFERIRKERKRVHAAKAELNETSSFKDDILGDFEQLKKQMLGMETDLADNHKDIEGYKSKLSEVKEQLRQKETAIMDIEQDNTRFVWGVVYKLFDIKKKFENYEIVKQAVDGLDTEAMRVLSKEVNDPERCKGLSYQEKKDAIMHLIHVISDITTTLHSENKYLLDSSSEVKSLKLKLDQQKLEFSVEIDQLQRDKECDLKRLSKEYEEKYVKFIENSKEEYTQKENEVLAEIDKIKTEYSDKCQEVDILRDENYDLSAELKQKTDYAALLKKILISLLFRAEELVFQKNLIKKEYSFLSHHLNSRNEEIEKLRQSIENY